MARLAGLISCAALAAMCGGCINCYTRCPGTDAKIERVYQSTKTAYAYAVIAAFPQMMSDSPDDYRIRAYNLLTIPLGIVVGVDCVCEAVVDTLALPIDIPLANSRKETP